jgi:hypothetical protein
MGDLMRRAARPRYDDPAPLGGSFLLQCASSVEQTGKTPIVVEDAKRDPHHDALSAREHERRAERRKIVKAAAHVCDAVLSLIAESLASKTSSGWVAYWFDEDHLIEYEKHIQSLAEFVHKLGLDEKLKDSKRYESDVLARFPSAEGELAFLRGVYADAMDQARDFARVTIAEDQSGRDWELNAMFHYHSTAFSMCMLTLEYLAHHRDLAVSKELVDAVFDLARGAALELSHTVMEAASLRQSAESEEEFAPCQCALVPDGDLADVAVEIRRLESGAKG